MENEINKKQELIKIILDVWDPMNLFPLAPDDEYANEINIIINFYNNTNDITMENLGVLIFETYKKSFDKDFDYSINDCNWIAQKIINVSINF